MNKTLTIFVLAFAFLASSTWALRVELDRPGLAFPKGFSEDARKRIQDVLEAKEARYLGGVAINWMSTLRYGGTIKALNHFLERLATCEGAVIRVVFVDGLLPSGTWHVHHSAHDEGGLAFTVRVDTQQLKLTQLDLPAIRGKAGPAKSEGSHLSSDPED